MRIFSGIQPTGRKHLGNYIGAIRQWVAMQDRGEAIYCLVDLHAITVLYEPEVLRRSVVETTAMLLAAGLDADRCVLFRQSDVPYHTELTWMLSAVTAHGDLNRMTQFKEKSARERELVSAGLFFYPVLQAADILLYETDEVPVGDDQRQHIELARDVAVRFNERFGETFTVPRHRIPAVGARIMDLQAPGQKMSTTGGSEAGTIYVTDDEAAISKKLRSAVTDSGTEVMRGPDKAGISNLIEILSVVRGAPPETVEAEFRDSGYGRFKQAVADEVSEYLLPVRARYAELVADQESVEAALRAGAERASELAEPTIVRARERMGVGAAAALRQL